MKAAIDVAVNQVAVATPSVSITVKITPFTVCLRARRTCRGGSSTFRHSASVVATFSSLTEKAAA